MTGELTYAFSVSVSKYTSVVSGNIAGLAISGSSGRLVVSLAGDGSNLGGIAVFEFEVKPTDKRETRNLQAPLTQTTK